jgi:hypothetical protein
LLSSWSLLALIPALVGVAIPQRRSDERE